MKTITTISIILGFVLICFSSCYYDVEEELYPITSTSCDTSSITFSGQVSLILQANCLNCHSTVSSPSIGGGIDLEGYDQLKIYVDNGKFLSSIIQDGTTSFMPKSALKLVDCDLAQITAWINAGALNN